MRGSRRSDADRTTVVLLFGLALLTVPLTGCIGDDAGPGDEPDEGVEPADRPGSPGSIATYDTEPSRTKIWGNGSFTLHEPVVGQYDLFSPDVDVRTVDVSDEVPSGIPLNLTAHLTYDESASDGASVRLFLDPGSSPVYSETTTQDPGSASLAAELAVFGDEPVDVGVNADMGQQSAELEYTLEIIVEAEPATVPPTAPTTIQIPDGADRIELEPTDNGTPVAAMVWEPSDELVGHASEPSGEAIEVPVQQAGEHVVMPNASSHVRLLDADGAVLEADGPLELLDTEFRWGEPHELPPDGGPETWSYEVPRAPLASAFRIEEPEGRSQTIDRIAIEASSPNGMVMDLDFDCSPPCMASGLAFGLAGVGVGPFADGNLTAGGYEMTASYDASARVSITPGWLAYIR